MVGITVAVLMIYSLSLVTTSVPGDKLGKATGVVFTGVGTSILLSGTLVPTLMEFGLAAAWAGLAAVGAVGVVIGWWGLALARETAEPETHAPPPWDWESSRPGGEPRPFRRRAGAALDYWVDYIARGLDLGMVEGGVQWVLVGIGAAGGTYLCGWLADRIGFAAALVFVFAALAVGIAIPVIFPGALVLIASSLIFGAQPGLSAVISGRVRQVVGARGHAACLAPHGAVGRNFPDGRRLWARRLVQRFR